MVQSVEMMIADGVFPEHILFYEDQKRASGVERKHCVPPVISVITVKVNEACNL